VPDDDAELVRRAAAGDPAAFGALVERHERRIYTLCLRMVGNAADASDAAQDAFLTAFRKLGSFRGDAAFTTWLHRIAVNASYDLLRKRSRAPLLAGPDADAPREWVAAVPDPADDAAGDVDVRRALAAVAEEFRAALVLHDVQDLPVQEVADILGIPVGTVKSRLHRGRIALARALAVGEPGEEGSASKGATP
jgi:RNA polymerase sigma-70 factor, ECF subfamily